MERSRVIELGEAPSSADGDEKNDPGGFGEETDGGRDNENAERRDMSNALTN